MFHKIFTKDVVHDLHDTADVIDGIRDRARVRDNAEVFTQPREVNAMLDLINKGPIPVNTTHLEPACGDGAFLTEITRRKLEWARNEAGSPRQLASLIIIALGSTYGIDISMRNVADAKRRMLAIVRPDLEVCGDRMVSLAEAVLSTNIVVGNFLKARGVMRDTPAWKKLKPAERDLVGFDDPKDEDIRFICIAPLEEYKSNLAFWLKTFTLRSMKSECLGALEMEDLNEQLWILAECDGSEVEFDE